MDKQQLQLVTYEQAKRLKKLGFDWYTQWYYNISGAINGYNQLDGKNFNSGILFRYMDTVSAPTVALALKWMRDICKRHASIYMVMHALSDNVYWAFDYRRMQHGDYCTYEAAELALLDELLTILEKEK